MWLYVGLQAWSRKLFGEDLCLMVYSMVAEIQLIVGMLTSEGLFESRI